MTSGINTLSPVVQKTENGKYSISIKQDKALTGDVEVLREQMIDVAVFKKTKVAGVTEDDWDEDGDLELSHKVDVLKV